MQAISTIAISHPIISAVKIALVDAWLRCVLWENSLPPAGGDGPSSGPRKLEVHRLKGILALDDGSFQIIQAVREVFEIRDAENMSRETSSAAGPDQCKIVIIGCGLGTDAFPWQQSFETYLRNSD
jgi:Cobalamin synthesis protein cobW C-terminal domain